MSMSSATTCARSTGAQPRVAPTSWSAPGGPNATGGWSSCSTPDAPRRAASVSTRRPATPAAGPGWTGRWTPRCCWPRSPRGPATTSTSSPTTGSPGPACSALRAPNCWPSWSRRWPRCNPRWSNPIAAAMVAAIARRTRRRALVVLLTDLNATALDEGLLPVLPQLSAKHQVIDRRGRRPAGRPAGRRARRCGRGLRRGGRRTVPQRPARRSRPGCAAAGWRSSTRRPTELAPALADRYLAMKATGRL